MEQTPYSTGPVKNLTEALYAFVESYDNLQKVINETAKSEHDFANFKHLLQLTMYRPVTIIGDERPALSLYEIGVVYFPATGKYSAHKGKLEQALRLRLEDIRALFMQYDGLLPRLCEILPEFLADEPPVEIFAASMRFLNECRRLSAMLV